MPVTRVDSGRRRLSIWTCLVCLLALAPAVGCGDGDEQVVTVTAPSSVAPPPPTSPAAPPTAPSPPSTAPTAGPQAEVPRPAGFPDPGEAVLLRRVNDAIEPFCTRSAEGDAAEGSSASLICDLRASDRLQVFIEGFPTAAEMNAALAAVRDVQGIPPDSGGCFGGSPPGESAYGMPGTAVSGRILCYTDGDGDFWLVWTEDATATLLWAFSDDPAAVIRFWPRNMLISQ